MENFDAFSPIHIQVEQTAKDQKIKFKYLEKIKLEIIKEQVYAKYCNGNPLNTIWESMCQAAEKGLIDCVAVSNDDAWTWIDKFLKESQAVLFFNHTEDECAFYFHQGKNIVAILENCYDFEFYITNGDVDYLLCFNHHRILYACGIAITWLKTFKNKDTDFLTN